MKFLYKKLLNSFEYGVTKSPVDRNLVSRLIMNLGIIDNYYSTSEVLIPNQGDFIKLIFNIDVLVSDDYSNSDISKSLSTNNKVDSKYSMKSEPNPHYPKIFIDMGLKQPIKVIDVGEDNIDLHLSLIHPLLMNIEDVKMVINPILLYDEMVRLDLTYQDTLKQIVFPAMIEQSFYISLFKSCLLNREYKPNKSNSTYFLISNSRYINRHIEFIHSTLNKRMTYLEVLNRIQCGEVSYYDSIVYPNSIFTNNSYSALFINTSWTIVELYKYCDVEINRHYLNEYKNLIRQVNRNDVNTLRVYREIKDIGLI